MSLHPDTQFITLPNFQTENGQLLHAPKLAYRTWGKLNENADNAVVIFHALSGSADADEWFAPLFGEYAIAKPEEHFIVCCNVPGSCYGSSSASDINPETGTIYGTDFPLLTIKDVVQLQKQVFDELGIKKIELALGGSMGGMQTLELCLLDQRVQKALIMAVGVRHSAWAVSWNHLQRQAIINDPKWNSGFYETGEEPANGLSLARQIAMISYRSFADYENKFGRGLQESKLPRSIFPYFQAESYLTYQGKKMVSRFDARAYINLTHTLDSHDITFNRKGDARQILSQIECPVLVVGIDSDLLYPLKEQEEMANLIPNAKLKVIHSTHGHDAFLIDFDQIIEAYQSFSDSSCKEKPHLKKVCS